VRALAHSPESAKRIDLPGVEVHVGDVTDNATTKRFLEGVDQLFLLTASTVTQAQEQEAIVGLARECGVKGIVKLSVYTGDSDALSAISRWHWENDRYIERSGIPFTILHPHTFMQTIGMLYAHEIKTTGRMTATVPGDVAMTMIDSRDVSEVAAAVLERGEHHGETLLLTGPEALSYNDCTRLISERIGRPVEYVQVSPAELAARFRHMGLPQWLGDGIVDIQRMFYKEQRWAPAPSTNLVRQWTGKPGRTFKDYLDADADLFR
jgi:uncharacterized protein YbjT (DUF2867 family)